MFLARLSSWVLLIVAFGGMGASLSWAVPPVGFIQHIVATADPSFGGITRGPDGALWFVESLGNKVGSVTPAGIITEYALPTSNSTPIDICSGSDGALWFTEQIGQIGRITTTGEITEFSAPSSFGITPGPDGALWFAGYGGSTIGRITTEGLVTVYPVGGFHPLNITAGPDGALWSVGENGPGQSFVGRITTDGSFTEYAVPTYDASVQDIAAGPDGALWFTETDGNKIGRITTSGSITEYPLAAESEPQGITRGPDNALWFSEFGAGQVGRITTSGALSEFSGAPGGLADLAFGPNYSLWLIGEFTQSVVQMVFTTAALQLTPTSGVPGTAITLTGTGFNAAEPVDLFFNSTSAKQFSTLIAQADGSITGSVDAYPLPLGTESFVARGRDSGKIAVANFGLQPALHLSQKTVTAGETITVEGFSYDSGDVVLLYFDGTGQVYANANNAGTFSEHAGNAVPFTIPADAAPGVHTIEGLGYYTLTDATVNVTVQ